MCALMFVWLSNLTIALLAGTQEDTHAHVYLTYLDRGTL